MADSDKGLRQTFFLLSHLTLARARMIFDLPLVMSGLMSEGSLASSTSLPASQKQSTAIFVQLGVAQTSAKWHRWPLPNA